jgi:hypothetical protein
VKKLLAMVLIGGLATLGCGYGPSSKKTSSETTPPTREAHPAPKEATPPSAHDEGKKDTGKKDEGKKDHKAPDKQP